MKVSSLLRKESPCAIIIKCIGASSHSEKGVSEWVKVYEAKNAVRYLPKKGRFILRTVRLVMRDLVFINWRTGEPAKNSSYDTHLYKLCDEAGIEKFCMHALRHTYATRAIESGVQPKMLQKLLGHASIKTTMDRYVHVTNDSMSKAVLQFEKVQQNQNGTVMVQ